MSTAEPGRPDLPVPEEDLERFDMIMQNGFKDNATWVSYNFYGDRFAAGSVDGKIRVFNRHSDGTWRLCDTWAAHGGEVLEVQWLPPTVYPNLIASLGIEGRFCLWAEDPGAAPGRRFSSRTSNTAGGSRAAFELRNQGAAPQAYRSFSIKHDENTRHTYLALLAADGMLTVLENEAPENLQEWTDVDKFQVCPKPARGEEQAFRVRFDPNDMVCYTALRAGVPAESLGLVVAAMNTCKLYRTRDASFSVGSTSGKEFYLAAELLGHTGLVRDVAWANGNIRGYDIIATACSDGFVRIFRVDTPFDLDDGKAWADSDIEHHEDNSQGYSSRGGLHDQSRASHSGIGAGLARAGPGGDRSAAPGQQGVIAHVIHEVGKHEKNRIPIWRVNFTWDGQILGSSGDDGKLVLYRKKPNGTWAKYSELGVDKAPMVEA
ncbi:Nucleoporin SEH1 [Zalerion maritima]|uniref:Nucleoporin SEH1 n=1 Tax=Zalerion maritima TaxID=339359 RepID=A0AAD5RT51_9PEZI|nr:Nucleoporin SEH1 [Zalerion maritima]